MNVSATPETTIKPQDSSVPAPNTNEQMPSAQPAPEKKSDDAPASMIPEPEDNLFN